MNPILDVITELYSQGIDCGLESYRGFGITAWVVDKQNRRRERQFETHEADAIALWLRQEADVQFAVVGGRADPGTRSLLAELAEGPRKDPKQISSRERDEWRHAGQGVAGRENVL